MTSTRTEAISRHAWLALALVALANMLSMLDRNILAILAPKIKADLHIGNAEMGLLYGTVFALFYAVFALPLGRLADGWMRNKLLSGAIAFWSLATLLAAFANNFAMLAVSRLGVGVGEGATNPAGNSLLFDYFPKARRGMALAVVSASVSLGLGGSLVLGGAAANWWDVSYPDAALRGWQFAFIVAATPGVLLSLMLWRMVEPARGALDGIRSAPDTNPFRASAVVFGSITPGPNLISLWHAGVGPRQWAINLGGLLLIVLTMRRLTLWTTTFSPRPPLDLGAITINPHALQWGVIGFGLFVILNWVQNLYRVDRPAFVIITRSPSMLLCLTAGALQAIVNYGVIGFTPSFVINTYHLSAVETGMKFGLLSAACGIAGTLISGPLSDRVNHLKPGSGRILVTIFALSVSPVIAFWTYRANDIKSFYVLFAGYSLIQMMWLPPFYAAMLDLALPRMRGMTSSLYIMLSTIIGLGIGPYLVGLLSDANGGNIGDAILMINWLGPLVVVLLVVLAIRIPRDEALVIARANAVGEPAFRGVA